jgi:hypothetical protein
MIDLACIFTTGGIILFYKAFCVLKSDLIEVLIKDNLAKDKNEMNFFSDPYRVFW